jgi:hypothetical protein
MHEFLTCFRCTALIHEGGGRRVYLSGRNSALPIGDICGACDPERHGSEWTVRPYGEHYHIGGPSLSGIRPRASRD